ncbi:MAG: ABC transporter ATP-binding protein [archaeon]|nr:ABC transporter ATP-binding protein [archaeon]
MNTQNENPRQELDRMYIFKEYFSFLKRYKWLFFITLFFVAIHEIKQIVDKFVFKIVMDKAELFINGTILANDFLRILVIAGIVFFMLIIVSMTSNWFKLHFTNKLESNMIFDLKQKYFNHIISLDHKFFTTHKTGSLISRLTRGGNAMERMDDVILFDFAPLIIQTITLLIALVYFDIFSAFIILSVVTIFLSYSIFFQRKMDILNRGANSAEDIEKGNIADIFTNVDSVKYFGKEDVVSNKYKQLSGETKNRFVIAWNAWRKISAGQSFILGSGTLILIITSFLKFMNGEMSLGTLTFIYTTYLSLMGPLFGFIHGVRTFSRSITDFEELFNYGKIKSAIENKPNSKNLDIKKGEVKFKDITFNYGKRKIFSNFNLNIPSGKKIALVGHSGSGKTTLVKLLYRFYDIDNGNITIDGKNIREVKQESLRSEMSIVPQECVLFDDSVYNNIAFSNPKASRAEVMKAIKFAQLDKIIEKFPNKEKTIVGERGVKLSGGEKQRVSIARAILADKKILVLDEATSSLDSETEFEIQKDLQKLMEGRTSVIIAHRLSTIMHADTIVVLKNGKIVQMGKHSKLITQPGEYKKLWNLQKGGYIG